MWPTERIIALKFVVTREAWGMQELSCGEAAGLEKKSKGTGEGERGGQAPGSNTCTRASIDRAVKQKGMKYVMLSCASSCAAAACTAGRVCVARRQPARSRWRTSRPACCEGMCSLFALQQVIREFEVVQCNCACTCRGLMQPPTPMPPPLLQPPQPPSEACAHTSWQRMKLPTAGLYWLQWVLPIPCPCPPPPPLPPPSLKQNVDSIESLTALGVQACLIVGCLSQRLSRWSVRQLLVKLWWLWTTAPKGGGGLPQWQQIAGLMLPAANHTMDSTVCTSATYIYIYTYIHTHTHMCIYIYICI